jgi:hypothetical protein
MNNNPEMDKAYKEINELKQKLKEYELKLIEVQSNGQGINLVI